MLRQETPPYYDNLATEKYFAGDFYGAVESYNKAIKLNLFYADSSIRPSVHQVLTEIQRIHHQQIYIVSY